MMKLTPELKAEIKEDVILALAKLVFLFLILPFIAFAAIGGLKEAAQITGGLMLFPLAVLYDFCNWILGLIGAPLLNFI